MTNCLSATATYTDAAASSEKSVAAVSSHPVQQKNDANLPPVFPDQDLETEKVQNTQTERIVPENTKSDPKMDPNPGDVGTPVVAQDPEFDKLTYSLGNGRDDASFSINRATGQLVTKAPLDYETKTSYTRHGYRHGPVPGEHLDQSGNKGHPRGRAADDNQGRNRNRLPGEWHGHSVHLRGDRS